MEQMLHTLPGGGLHGIVQAIEKMTKQKNAEKNSFNRIICCICTFVTVSIIWIFFRATSISDAFYIIKNSLVGIGHPINYIRSGYSDMNFALDELVMLAVSIVLLLIYDYYSIKGDVINTITGLKKPTRWLIYFGFIWLIIVFKPLNASKEFVYFQF